MVFPLIWNGLIKRRPLLLLFFFAVAIHVWNIGVDLPNNYYTDEPHHMNKAAQFGTGDLNPHDFKYPSLWSYMLAGMLGAMYLGGRVTGIVASTTDFAQKYLYHPAIFFLFGRLLSTLFLCLLPFIFYAVGTRFYSRRLGLTVCLLTILSTALAEFGLQAIPYSALVFFAGLAVYCVHGVFEGEGRKAYAKTGLFIGLATSCHYVAAPFGSLLLIAFFQPGTPKERTNRFLIGSAAAIFGFFCGTPFLLTSLKAAAPIFTEHYQLENVSVPSVNHLSQVLGLLVNVVHFMDPWGVGFFLFLVGLTTELKRRHWRVLLWLAPLASAAPILALSYFGTVTRYTILLAIPLFIPAAQGFVFLSDLCGAVRWRQMVLGGVFVSTFASCYALNRLYIAIPDTRTLAKTWIEKNANPGDKILVAGAFDGPQLMRSRAQVERLYRKTTEEHHPRAAYFKTLLDGHPGGGYDVLYVQKTVDEVLDLPSRTARAFQAQEAVDVATEGIAPLLRDNVRFVAITKSWENQDRHREWLRQLRARYALAATFAPEERRVKGFTIEIYSLGDPR